MSWRSLSVFVLILMAFAVTASAQELDCIKCHTRIKKDKVLHPAVDMGCSSCHAVDDIKTIPHKKGKIAKFLSSSQPDLCYGCHDQKMFTKKTVHAAVGMGCTTCHNPHSAPNAKLLRAEMPELCYGCHNKDQFMQKTQHAALGMGCTACHSPHSSDNPKLLSQPQPDLCYTCHNKEMFTKKVVHTAVTMGCTGCHNPHSSKASKLLPAESPDLCFTCHDKGEFSKKTIHSPVEGGMCLSCHSPHSTNDMALLLKRPIEVCLECHPDVPKKQHAVAGFSAKGHPVGLPKKAKKAKKEGDAAPPDQGLKDPSRPDKPFYCGSCHNPHSTIGIHLFRFNATSAMGLCTNCHKM